MLSKCGVYISAWVLFRHSAKARLRRENFVLQICREVLFFCREAFSLPGGTSCLVSAFGAPFGFQNGAYGTELLSVLRQQNLMGRGNSVLGSVQGSRGKVRKPSSNSEGSAHWAISRA